MSGAGWRVALAVAVALAGSGARAEDGRRLALVVGTSRYDAGAVWPGLANATGDAGALGAELGRRYGFDVTTLADPDVATFKGGLKKIAEAAGPSDDVVVFVSGHGHFDEEDHVGYLVMRDATAGCAAGCYPFDNIKRALFGTHARHVLVLLDVCYGGTFDARVAFSGDGERAKSDTLELRRAVRDYAQYPSRLVFASVGRAVTGDGRAGGHSPFVAVLLRELASPDSRGVVALDRVFTAMTSGADPLPVERPMPFDAQIAHHPSGTFLFMEHVDLCAAAAAIAASQAGGFADVPDDDVRSEPYGVSRASEWVLPDGVACRLWRWSGAARPELRCELGDFPRAAAATRTAALLAALKACPVFGSWQASERARADGPADQVIEGDGRRARIATTCAEMCDGGAKPCPERCGVSLVFE